MDLEDQAAGASLLKRAMDCIFLYHLLHSSAKSDHFHNLPPAGQNRLFHTHFLTGSIEVLYLNPGSSNLQNLQKYPKPLISEGSIVSKEREGRIIADQIFKGVGGLNLVT